MSGVSGEVSAVSLSIRTVHTPPGAEVELSLYCRPERGDFLSLPNFYTVYLTSGSRFFATSKSLQTSFNPDEDFTGRIFQAASRCLEQWKTPGAFVSMEFSLTSDPEKGLQIQASIHPPKGKKVSKALISEFLGPVKMLPQRSTEGARASAGADEDSDDEWVCVVSPSDGELSVHSLSGSGDPIDATDDKVAN